MADDRRRQSAWRTGNARPAAEPGPRKRGVGKRFLLLILVLTIVGVLIGVLTFASTPPRPVYLGVAVTQYASPVYPPNPWAQQDSDALRQRFESDSAQAYQAQDKTGLLAQLDVLGDTRRQGRRAAPHVVLLSAHAVAREGKILLIPGRADPDNPTTWLPLAEVLLKVSNAQGPRLLLLDLVHPAADAHAGLLCDNVADVLHDELTAADKNGKLPFFVLTACRPGEVGRASLELRRSVFGFFVEQALLGHADGWVNADQKDNRVSALELAEYVRVQVAWWTARQRAGQQTPQLYGQAQDFVLISPHLPFTAIQLPEAPPDYLSWLQDGWKERDAWKKARVYRLMPRLYRELETLLLQTEQRWLAGESEEAVKTFFTGRFDDLKKKREELRPGRYQPRSLAEASRAGIDNEEAIAAAVRGTLELLQRKIAVKPDDVKKLLGTPEKPLEAPPYAGIASEALSALLKIPNPSLDHLKGFDGFLNALAPPPSFTELAALRFQVDLEPRTQDRWNDKALEGTRRIVLEAAQTSEQAAVIDPRTLPWLRTDLAAADANLRDCIVALATGDEDARVTGRQKLIDTVAAYRQIIKTAGTLEAGYHALEEARMLLPALAVSLAARDPDENDRRLWPELVANTAELDALLTPGTRTGPPRLDKIGPLTEQLNFGLRTMRMQFSPDAADSVMALAQKENGPSAEQIRRLLASPLWDGPVRVKLYNAARDIGKTAAEDALGRAAAMPPRSAAPPPQPRPPDAVRWRARLALDLLGLDGVSDVKTLEELAAKVERDRNACQELAEAIRRAWAVTLPEKFRALTDPAARERAGIILHPLDVSVLPAGPGAPAVEPTAQIQRELRGEFWTWLARERYRKASEAYIASKRDELKAYGTTLEDVRQDLLRRAP